MKCPRNKRNEFHSFRQNSHTIEPRSTEILSCYDTFITKEPYQLSKYSNKKITHTGTISSNISLPFNDETILIDQCTSQKCKSIKHFLKETNKEYISSYLLPMIKIQKGEILTNLLLLKPQKKYAFRHLSNEITNKSILSQNIHQLRSTYLIDKVLRENKHILEKVKISIRDNRSPEEIEESYDTVIFEDLKLIRLKKEIKEFLCAKDNKLNQIASKNNEKLFKTYPDIINYYYDIYLVPHIKNKLGFYEDKFKDIDKYKNIIDSGICRYLNRLKIRLQRKKDKKQNRKYTSRLERKIKPNYQMIEFKNKKEPEVTYEFELFFEKMTRYSLTRIATPKVKDIVFNDYQVVYNESE